MAITKEPRRAVRNLHRAIDFPRVFAWPTGNGATALPEVLDEATYTVLASVQNNEAPQLLTGTAASGIFCYRPGADEKVLSLEFCSATGADGDTQVWELGAYGFPYYAPGSTTFRPWKLLGSARFTLTLGTRTLASQTVDPWMGTVDLGGSRTLRWADTYAETYNDFGDPQLYTTGYGATNASGRLVFDLAFVSLVAIRLVTKAASSTTDLCGIWTECS
jgi:hypothetical protein